jgi:hypothetical protein
MGERREQPQSTESVRHRIVRFLVADDAHADVIPPGWQCGDVEVASAICRKHEGPRFNSDVGGGERRTVLHRHDLAANACIRPRRAPRERGMRAGLGSVAVGATSKRRIETKGYAWRRWRRQHRWRWRSARRRREDEKKPQPHEIRTLESFLTVTRCGCLTHLQLFVTSEEVTSAKSNARRGR